MRILQCSAFDLEKQLTTVEDAWIFDTVQSRKVSSPTQVASNDIETLETIKEQPKEVANLSLEDKFDTMMNLQHGTARTDTTVDHLRDDETTPLHQLLNKTIKQSMLKDGDAGTLSKLKLPPVPAERTPPRQNIQPVVVDMIAPVRTTSVLRDPDDEIPLKALVHRNLPNQDHELASSTSTESISILAKDIRYHKVGRHPIINNIEHNIMLYKTRI